MMLRDHSQPCEHEDIDPNGRIRGHWDQTVLSAWGFGNPRWCPGGREITDDGLRTMLDDLAKEMDRPRDYDEAGA